MSAPAVLNGELAQSKIVNHMSMNWKALFEVLGLPTEKVTSFKLEIAGPGQEAVVTLTRYITEDEFVAIIGDIENNPPVSLEKKESLL